MKIRYKLTLQFSAIVAIILILFSICIFYVADHFRSKNFNKRLKEKAVNTANLLIEVEEINLSLLKNIRRNYLASLPQEFVRIYGSKNNLIYYDDSIQFRISEDHLNYIRKEGFMEIINGERQVVGILYKNKYVITSSAIDLDGIRQMKDLQSILLVGNLFGLILIFLSGKFFSIQALKPISILNKEAENINENNLNLRLKAGSGNDEISQLAKTFNKLFDRIEDAFNRQRRFVSNASHELRTPLTAITGEIEVSLMKERCKEDYIEVLKSVLEEAKTLTKLSNGLLQLANTSEIKGISVERINVYLLVERIKEETQKRFSGDIQFSYEGSTPLSHIEINGNEELLKTALMNLIENGFKFSNNKPVLMKIETDKKNIILKIIDNGIGIKEEEIEQILQPFYRGDNASHIPGHGIGLSLTNKIVRLHEGKMAIYSLNKETIVLIQLPKLEDELN